MPPVRLSAFRPSRGLVATFLGSAAAGFGYHQYSLRSGDEESGSGLNPSSFTPYTLLEKQPVSRTSSIFTLRHVSKSKEQRPEASSDGLGYIWDNCIWSVQAKQPQLQIARSYTPLPPIRDGAKSGATGEGEIHEDDIAAEKLRLLIRAEKNGEVSNYLHSLPPASEIALRGPFVELQLPPDLREVIFIAGGTGIAPALQVAHILSQRPGARMRIFWNTRHGDECQGGVSDPPATLSRSPARRTASDWDPWSKISRLASFATAGESLPTSSDAVSTAAVGALDRNLVVQELEALKAAFAGNPKDAQGQQGTLAVEYFVDDNNKFVKPKDVSRHMRHIAQETEEQGSRGDKKLILVSGPEGFIELWAGKKVWMGGKEMQGPLGGYFSHLGLTAKDWKIWKL